MTRQFELRLLPMKIFSSLIILVSVSGPLLAVDFAADVQPIFAKHCLKCHGPKKQKNSFRLDWRAAAMKGGSNGAAILPGNSKDSPLIKNVTAAAEDDQRMPPKGDGLSSKEVAVLRQWIDAGAPWPDGLAGKDPRLKHWAFQPIFVKGSEPQSIDAFIAKKLTSAKLTMFPEASRRSLIRRLSFTLHGLPPSPASVDAFIKDPAPRAYDKLVERMLNSPHYGERFARHWLDLAHYADTHGFERDRRRDNAWRYRDYVIQAFNEDKAYDRFLQEQIAGDVLWPKNEQAVVATGFLAAGPWDFVGQSEAKSGIIKRASRSLDLDDMATQVMTATMATTVNCARCHDHKLDPISQEEYYQLRAVFAGVKRADRPISESVMKGYAAAQVTVAKQISQFRPGLNLADIVGGGKGKGGGKFKQGIDPRSGKVEARPMGYLSKVEANRFAASSNPFVDGVVIPRSDKGKAQIPISSTEITVTGIPGANAKAWDIIRNGPVNSTHSSTLGGIDFSKNGNSMLGLHANAAITFDLKAFREALKEERLQFSAQLGYFGVRDNGSFADAWVFVDGKKAVEFRKLMRADGLKMIDLVLPEKARFLTLMATAGGNGIGMDQIAFGNPIVYPDGSLLSAAARQRLAELEAEKKALAAKIAKLDTGRVYSVVAEARMPAVRVLRRGDAETPVGDPLAPGALSALAMLDPALEDQGSVEGKRRAALARWITNPANPLTPRVIVNRLWHWHFGQGLVDTPSDFGHGGSKPSHPELLDWLARELLRQGWSLKAMHRLILTSAAFKQDSRYLDNAEGEKIDSGNRLLWRQNPRRIEAEALRDSVLFVSGKLNHQRGGPGFEDFKYQGTYAPIYTYITADKPALWRRSIYRYIVRTTPDRFMTTLDCPDPANMTPKRLTTTTPLQSLALYNNDFMLRQAQCFATRLEAEAGSDNDAQVRRAFTLALSRDPSTEERALATKFIRDEGLFAFCRSVLNLNEFVYVD